MRRRKPNSGKAKKEHLQAHRALKANNASLLVNPPADRGAQTVVIAGANQEQQQQQQRERARQPQRAIHDGRNPTSSARAALESRFIKLAPAVLEHYKTQLAKRPFDRPVDASKAILDDQQLGNLSHRPALVCPKRPKWKYYMLKKEVEKNEQVMFDKWLLETETRLKRAEAEEEFKVMGYFERNLDVWRQLWRVAEASEILCVLLDTRCPLLHFPPSLQDYIFTLRPRKQCILVLTKADLVPASVADAWKRYLEASFGYSVVLVQSYKEEDRRARTQGSRRRYLPAAPSTARHDLTDALKLAHHDLISPPAAMKPENRARWKPKIRTTIDWERLERQPEVEEVARSKRDAEKRVEEADLGKAEARKARRLQRQAALGAKVHGRSGHAAEVASEADHSGDEADSDAQEPESENYQEPPFMSIGLIGQPNVGKSSLLNALLGKKVVRASRTPGKTKHLQTIFWTPEVRLVDCPGLVFPSYVGMEKQVLSGVIPIQNVESVIYEIGQRMPLETIVSLEKEAQLFSTDEVLSTYALNRGFLTAKAARPDVYRAGAMIIRSFQASQIPWAFVPPGTFSSHASSSESNGIWLEDFQPSSMSDDQLEHNAEEYASTSGAEHLSDSAEEDAKSGSESEASSDDAEEDDEENPDNDTATVGGAFALLGVEDSRSDDDEEEED